MHSLSTAEPDELDRLLAPASRPASRYCSGLRPALVSTASTMACVHSRLGSELSSTMRCDRYWVHGKQSELTLPSGAMHRASVSMRQNDEQPSSGRVLPSSPGAEWRV